MNWGHCSSLHHFLFYNVLMILMSHNLKNVNEFCQIVKHEASEEQCLSMDTMCYLG